MSKLQAPKKAEHEGDVSRVALPVLVCLVMLLGAWVARVPCLQGPEGTSCTTFLDSDITLLYDARGIDQDTFPYIHGSFEQGALGAIEYPVLTGLFMWVSGLLVEDARNYLLVSSLLLAPFAVVAAYLLARMVGLRALLFTAAPAVVFYSFLNWDLLAVASTVTGFWLWWRGSPLWAAVMFGIGASFKVYPGLFVLPLSLAALAMRDRRGALSVAAAGVGTFAAVNLPFALINFEGWWATYSFQAHRGPNYDSLWYQAFRRLQPEDLNTVTLVLLVGSIVAILAYAWRTMDARGRVFPVVQSSAALLAAFLLWSKVQSPQYALWILPMFALVRISFKWWLAFIIADLAVFFGAFDFVKFQSAGGDVFPVLVVGVFARAVVLAALIVVFLRATVSLRPEPQAGLQGRLA